MKKKLLSIMLIGVFSVGMLAGCGNKQEDTPAASDAAGTESNVAPDSSDAASDENEKTTFVVGFDAEYPPYGYMDEAGEYTGFDLEVAEAVCEITGWELVKQPISWDAKDQELESGAIDCIWSGFTINGREDLYEWTDAYVNNEQVIVVAADSGITSLSELEGKIVGVQQASAALDVLSDEEQMKDLADTFAELREFSDYNVAFTELQAGSLEALAIDVGVAEYQISSRGEDEYVILSEPLNSEQYGVGFKLGNTELRDQVNEALHTLAADGTIATIAEKYDIADMICIE